MGGRDDDDDVCDTHNVERVWDAEYESGRYEGESPVPFVDTITDTLRKRDWTDASGLYVGCGSERNFIPLAAVCPGLRGIDVSRVGIRLLLEKHPEYKGRVSCENFLDIHHDKAVGKKAEPLDYVVSIQAFQHGDEQTTQKYFEQAASMLRPGGLLFLRVNSARTDVNHAHDIVERNDRGGFTVRYKAGPKTGLCVHFFSDRELESVLHRAGFDAVGDPVETSERRRPPETGTWRQWEVVAVMGTQRTA